MYVKKRHRLTMITPQYNHNKTSSDGHSNPTHGHASVALESQGGLNHENRLGSLFNQQVVHRNVQI